MQLNVCVLVVAHLLATLAFRCTHAGIHQKELLAFLFRSYDPAERPVKNEEESLQVTVGLSVQQIVDVDENKQTIFFSGWLDMCWNDYNLVWDPLEFGNITKIRVSSTKIWTPDLLLYNSADSFDSTSKVNGLIESNGNTCYVPPGMFRSTCSILVDDWPFDEQVCTLKFGSWTYDESKVNLTNKGNQGSNDSYMQNNEWFLQDIISYSNTIVYDCCPDEKYPFVMFEIKLRRRTLYYVLNLIVPCILISLMSLLGFSLPSDTGEKMGLEVTVLLAIFFFSQQVQDMIPPSSLSVPKLTLYFNAVMIISVMSIIANIVVLVLHHRNVKIQEPMPKWVEVIICGYLARMLRMKCNEDEKLPSVPAPSPVSPTTTTAKSDSQVKYFVRDSPRTNGGSRGSRRLVTTSPTILDINENIGLVSTRTIHLIKNQNTSANTPTVKHKSSRTLNERASSKHLNQLGGHGQQATSTASSNALGKSASAGFSHTTITTTTNNNHNNNHNEPSSGNNSNNNCNSNSKKDSVVLKRNLCMILRELRLLTKKLREDEEDESKGKRWKFAAMVIDRLCMIIFSIANLTSTFAILLTAKNVFKDSNPDPKF